MAEGEAPAAAYDWVQNDSEVLVKVPVPESLRRGDVQLKVRKTHLQLSVSGAEICSGELAKEVDPEETSWSFESEGGVRLLVVNLQKVNRSALKSGRQWPCLWSKDVSAVAQKLVDESLASAAGPGTTAATTAGTASAEAAASTTG
mmetsp:Transcript_25135/g.34015  ORF Transcript_25135/g.34015 Transcript_25135/m.34015 type:complete len:146 (-) Transcript_25135:52-489(-)